MDPVFQGNNLHFISSEESKEDFKVLQKLQNSSSSPIDVWFAFFRLSGEGLGDQGPSGESRRKTVDEVTSFLRSRSRTWQNWQHTSSPAYMRSVTQLCDVWELCLGLFHLTRKVYWCFWGRAIFPLWSLAFILDNCTHHICIYSYQWKLIRWQFPQHRHLLYVEKSGSAFVHKLSGWFYANWQEIWLLPCLSTGISIMV